MFVQLSLMSTIPQNSCCNNSILHNSRSLANCDIYTVRFHSDYRAFTAVLSNSLPDLSLGVYMGRNRDERAGEMVVWVIRAAELKDMLTPEMR